MKKTRCLLRGGIHLKKIAWYAAKVRNIRLLHARPDSSVLADIIEKFRYETGIVPAITE